MLFCLVSPCYVLVKFDPHSACNILTFVIIFSANCDGNTLKDMLCKCLNGDQSEMQMLAAKWFVAETTISTVITHCPLFFVSV